MSSKIQVTLANGLKAEGIATDLHAIALMGMLLGEDVQALVWEGKWDQLTNIQERINAAADEKAVEVANTLEEDLAKGDEYVTKALNELVCEELGISLPETGEENFKEKYDEAFKKLPEPSSKKFQAAKTKITPRLIKLLSADAVFRDWLPRLVAQSLDPRKGQTVAYLLCNVYHNLPPELCSYSIEPGQYKSRLAFDMNDLRDLLLTALSKGFEGIKE